MIEHDKI